MQFLTSEVSLLRQLGFLLAALFLIVPATSDVQAQLADIRLSIVSLDSPKIGIKLESKSGSTQWSFRNSYAAYVGLAERIQNFRGTDALGREVPVTKVAPGEFRFPEKVTRVSYDVQLNPPSKLGDFSHVSWLNKEHGLLMLSDLLPQVGMGLSPVLLLNFELPSNWEVAASRDSEGHQYIVSRPEHAVFAVGAALRAKTTQVGNTEVRIATIGDWSFSDSDLREVVGKIVKEYTRVLRQPPPGKVALLLLPYSSAAGPERWSAETRGADVVLLMGRQGSSRALLARLEVVLAHELLHLWVPNALNLQGNYDWFFEGFTVYQALLTALRLHYIKFEDYLETLSRVHDSYRSSTERDKLSLLEASERRWTTASSVVYDRGVLVAFIYDLMLRQQSGSRATISDVYPEVLRMASGQDANELLMMILNRREGMERFSEKYVQSSAEIELESFLSPFGLQFQSAGSRFQIRVSNTINAEQHRLLKTLGYKGRR